MPVMDFQKRENKIIFLPKEWMYIINVMMGSFQVMFLLLFSTSNFEKILVKNVSWVEHSPVFIICTYFSFKTLNF